VLIYDCHLAVCVYPPLWNLWSLNENYYPREWLRKQSRSAKSLVRFRFHHSKEWLKLADAAFFGWNLKGITETLGVLIYDHHLAVCVYPPLWNLWSPNENYPREWRYSQEAIYMTQRSGSGLQTTMLCYFHLYGVYDSQKITREWRYPPEAILPLRFCLQSNVPTSFVEECRNIPCLGLHSSWKHIVDWLIQVFWHMKHWNKIFTHSFHGRWRRFRGWLYYRHDIGSTIIRLYWRVWELKKS
jgi:hypothetical protein